MSLKDFKTSVGHMLYRQIGRASGHLQNTRSLPVDVLESDRSYLVVFDAPGAESEDVKVRYLSGSIRIQVQRFRQYREQFEMRFPGRGMTLEGDVKLPDDAAVDPDSGTARLSEAGTLRIEVPKTTAEKEDVEPEDNDGAETDRRASSSVATTDRSNGSNGVPID